MWGFINFGTIKLRNTQKNSVAENTATSIDSQSFSPYAEM